MSDSRSSLTAVARVRRVREQDSLLGLLQAQREADDAGAVLAGLQDRLAPTGSTGQSLAAFVALRTGLVALEQASTLARADLEAADSIAASARAHWQADRCRLEAIEMLQERRGDQHRAEIAQAEAKELDEVATQLWARRAGEAS